MELQDFLKVDVFVPCHHLVLALTIQFSETGISIPSSYTAHLAPLSSSKLYNEARLTKDEKSMETPYVVMFQAVNILSGTKASLDGRCGPQIQECWEFEHPRRDAVLNSHGKLFTVVLPIY
jgi:protein arginine N-methyltransferase 5